VDVRTPVEFMGGNVNGSINIPLQEIPTRLDELRSFEHPLVQCCALGGRSAQATNYLTHQGLACLNAGSWFDVNYYQSLNN
jgi:rhodanese-related sulfurtransferase